MPNRSLYLVLFSVSLAAILLEIAYTRVFSFKLYYLFTYLIIGVGLSGLGAGGVLVAVWRRLREAEPSRLLPLLGILGGGSAALGYLLIAATQINILQLTSGAAEIGKLVMVCVALALPFLATGIIVASVLGSRPEAAGKLYGADLLGAALGCALAVPLLTTLGPPTTVILASLILAASGLPLALRSKGLMLTGLSLTGALALLVLNPHSLPEPVVDKAKLFEEFRKGGLVEYSKWHPVFRVDVSRHPYHSEGDSVHVLFHDGQPGSGLRAFDGDRKSIAYVRRDPRALPFSLLGNGARVLIIGSAGGFEILASLYFRAEHVTAVEINPVTVSLLTDEYAELTGRLAENPRVTLINGEGRWFLKQSRESYDLIWFVATDSYAAMNASTSGSYVLSESYLYTVEALQDALGHLTEDGVICAQFGEIDYDNRPNRTLRYLTTARQAFAENGLLNFDRRVLLASAPGFPPFQETVVLLGNSPFDGARMISFGDALRRIDGARARYVPGRNANPNDSYYAYQAITLSDKKLPSWYANYPYLIDPARDDSPFFWHFTGYLRSILEPAPQTREVVDFENGVGERTAVALLLLVSALAAVLLLSPIFAIRKTWLDIPHKTRAALYFASLGLGFMFIEVSLIQIFTLFLGYPTYSLSVTLFGMLVFSGVGSLLSDGYGGNRGRNLAVLLAALAALILLFQFALPPLIDRFIGHSLGLRIALVTAAVAPLGIVLGSFMPMGLRAFASTTPHRRQLVAWAWAVNGFFSVVASVLSTILAMTIGFRLVLALALLIYAAGALALSGLPTPASAD